MRNSKGQYIKGENGGWLGRKHRPETIQKLRLAKLGKTGPLCNNWQGGKALGKRSLSSPEIAAWRNSVFLRDNFTCVNCGLHGSQGVLHADHILPWAFFPEERFNLTNGRTLCVPCHEKTDTYKGRAASKYRHLATKH